MRRSLSPRDLADAIGVSESSLKRWADAGRIHVVRTAGGHRRIPLAEAVRFIRDTGQHVVRPELLGLVGDVPDVDPTDRLAAALMRGDARDARALMIGAYLRGEPIAAICDGPLRDALVQLGELWLTKPDGIFLEHRATDICTQVLAQLRGLVEVREDAPVAIGGAPSGDAHHLPSFMASVVLAAEGWNAVHLGAETPPTAFAHAIAAHQPRLVWISATTAPSPAVTRELAALADAELARGRAVVVGGRAAARIAAKSDVFVASTMAELAAFVRGLSTAR